MYIYRVQLIYVDSCKDADVNIFSSYANVDVIWHNPIHEGGDKSTNQVRAVCTALLSATMHAYKTAQPLSEINPT